MQLKSPSLNITLDKIVYTWENSVSTDAEYDRFQLFLKLFHLHFYAVIAYRASKIYQINEGRFLLTNLEMW